MLPLGGMKPFKSGKHASQQYFLPPLGIVCTGSMNRVDVAVVPGDSISTAGVSCGGVVGVIVGGGASANAPPAVSRAKHTLRQ